MADRARQTRSRSNRVVLACLVLAVAASAGAATTPQEGDCNVRVPKFRLVEDAVRWAQEYPECCSQVMVTIHYKDGSTETIPATETTYDYLASSQSPPEYTLVSTQTQIGINTFFPLQRATMIDGIPYPVVREAPRWAITVISAVILLIVGFVIGRRSARPKSPAS